MNRFEEVITEITKSDFKKKKRAKEIRKRKHVRRTPAQKQALRKARKKSHTAGAQRKRKITKKQRTRKGIYSSFEGMIDNILNESTNYWVVSNVSDRKLALALLQDALDQGIIDRTDYKRAIASGTQRGDDPDGESWYADDWKQLGGLGGTKGNKVIVSGNSLKLIRQSGLKGRFYSI